MQRFLNMIKTMIWGHRGYPAKFPENSMAGFRYVLDHHIEGIEFDVHLTRDNVPVIMHDEDIRRTTNGKGYIKRFTLAELRRFKLANGEPIPTLDEFLTLVENKDVHLNLEFKTDKFAYPDIEKIVLAKVSQYHLRYPVIYSSFNMQTLRNCEALAPDGNYCFLKKTPLLHPLAVVQREHLSGLHLHFYQDVPGVVERIWTVDEPHIAIMLFRKQVDGIFTNNFEAMTILRNKLSQAAQFID